MKYFLSKILILALSFLILSCKNSQSVSLEEPPIIPLVEKTETPIITDPSGILMDSGQRLGEGRSWDLALGDLDGDGDLDALVANGPHGNTGSQVWLNDGLGLFSKYGEELSAGMGLDLGDLDQDGDLDAIIVSWDAAGRIWLNDGMGGFSDSDQILGEPGGFDATLGDLDGDGDLDAFIAHNDSNTVWMNNGEGIYENSGQMLGETYSAAVALADFDNDGDLDAATAGWDEPGMIWLNDGTGIFQESGNTLSSGSIHMHGLAWGDLNGDGTTDLVLAGSPNQVWFNDGSGNFSSSDQDLPRTPGDTVALGDLDQDGDLDVYLAVGKSSLANDLLWLNDGKGEFLIMELDLSEDFSTGIGLGDLDGNGTLDVFLSQGNLSLSNGGGLPNQVWLGFSQ